MSEVDPFDAEGVLHEKNFFSKAQIEAIKQDLGLDKGFPHKHLVYVRPKLYRDPAMVDRLSLLVKTELHPPNEKDRNAAWLLWFLPQYDKTFYSAENPHTDLLRYEGKQFRFLVPLILDGEETLTYLPPTGEWKTIKYVIGDLYVLQAGRTMHYASVSGQRKMLLVMDYVQFPDKPRWFQQMLTQYFHTVKLSMDVHPDAVIPSLSDIQKGELTKHCTPFVEGKCPRLHKRLVDMFLPLHPLPVHQSRKAVAKALGKKPPRIVLSPYHLSISPAELEDIAREIRQGFPGTDVIVSENMVQRLDERLFLLFMRLTKFVGAQVGGLIGLQQQSPVQFYSLLVVVVSALLYIIYQLLLQ